MKQLVMERECLGHPVHVQIDIPADGLAVLLTGGCKPHIGAVSAAEPGRATQTTQFAGHRDGAVSGGIHYDDLSREGLEEVLNCCNLLLQDVFTSIDKIR